MGVKPWLKPWLLLFAAFSLNAPAAVPYEICSEENQAWTDHFIEKAPSPSEKKTEAGYCRGESCSREDPGFKTAQALYKGISGQKEGDIPPLCFYGAMLRSKKKPRVYNCSKSDSENPLPSSQSNGSRPCFNEDYVQATAQAFNTVTDCFDFSKKDKDRLFALLNHESSFLLNAKSHGMARCFGQLTINNIRDTNSRIYFQNRMSVVDQNYGGIYKRVVQKCPELKDKIIPPELALAKAQKASKRESEEEKLEGMQERAAFTCGVTHDPISCLFYSAYSMQMSALDFRERYRQAPDYMGNRRDPSRRERKDFLFPVMWNEVLVVQGRITRKENGETVAKDFVFWDSSELHDFNAKITYKRKDLKIKKVPLFERDVLEAAFLFYAHNGGRDIVRTHWKVFMKDLKKRIAAGKSCNRDKDCAKYRAALTAGRPLSFDDLQTEFAKYAEEANLDNKEELKEFIKKADDHMRFLHNTGMEAPDEIKRKLVRFSGADPRAADSFVQALQKNCPRSPFSP